MVELKFIVSDVDYESVIQAVAGRVPAPILTAARALPDDAKEEMIVRFINANASQMERWLENALASKGVSMKISRAQATKLS